MVYLSNIMHQNIPEFGYFDFLESNKHHNLEY